MAVKSRSLLVLTIVGIVLVTAFLLLLIIPVKRIVGYKVMVKSNPLVVYKDLSDQQNWKNWMLDSSENNSVELVENKEKRTVQYVVTEKNKTASEGIFTMHTALNGSTVLQNQETIYYRTLGDKISFFFDGGEMKKQYNSKVDALKTRLEQPSWEKAGIVFSSAQMGNLTIGALSDTIPVNTAGVQIISMYNKLRTGLPQDMIENEFRPQSRFKFIEGTDKMFLQVGINLKDSLTKVSPPFKRLHVPPCKLIIASFKGQYEQIPEAMEILRDWIVKNQLMVATVPWVEHQLISTNQQVLLTDSLAIIQPVYFWPKN